MTCLKGLFTHRRVRGERGENQDKSRRTLRWKSVSRDPFFSGVMNSPERMISTHEVRAVVYRGVVIENYPEDARGHSS